MDETITYVVFFSDRAYAALEKANASMEDLQEIVEGIVKRPALLTHGNVEIAVGMKVMLDKVVTLGWEKDVIERTLRIFLKEEADEIERNKKLQNCKAEKDISNSNNFE